LSFGIDVGEGVEVDRIEFATLGDGSEMVLRRFQLIVCVTVSIAAAALGGPACSKSGASGGGGSAGSAGTGNSGGFGGSGEDCDTKETECGDATSGCVACAEAFACRDELNACNNSMECRQYGQCIQKCAQGDDACTADCAASSPLGASRYGQLLECVVCKHCPVECDAPSAGCAP
jgi:hypothetical protein